MTKRCFFYIKCVLFVLVLSISGEISAQEKRDSVRIYFHQGKVNIDTCLLDNGNEMERFAKICSALNDSVRLIRKIQIIGGASPEGGGLLNGRLSEKRAEVLWRYISPYIKIPVLEKDFHFSGSDWNGLITMVRAGCECSGEGGCPSFVGEDRPFGKPGQPLFGGRTEKTERGEAILIFV